jgi:hypothetical protein
MLASLNEAISHLRALEVDIDIETEDEDTSRRLVEHATNRSSAKRASLAEGRASRACATDV